MKVRFAGMILALLVTTLAAAPAGAQSAPAGGATAKIADANSKVPANPASIAGKRKQFVIDVVRMAAALPVPDQQDRLRVLYSASSVISPVDHSMAVSFSREGLRIEQELIQQGKTPAVSMLDSGGVDCDSAKSLAENIPAANVDSAGQTLVGVVSACASAVETVRRLLEAGFEKGRVAPRAALAVMERVGVKAPWSQQAFEKLFANLPAEANAFPARGRRFCGDVYPHGCGSGQGCGGPCGSPIAGLARQDGCGWRIVIWRSMPQTDH